ncbi:hypothetical protein [Rhodomicrobium lacus]|uniref:hypothetical protein n=1 Tax=Rhodomicrobium lacus TaxID=2498452 RepID=UPI000F8E6472|nr:hypothetical protein [Rhodomicrobium lacus]
MASNTLAAAAAAHQDVSLTKSDVALIATGLENAIWKLRILDAWVNYNCGLEEPDTDAIMVGFNDLYAEIETILEGLLPKFQTDKWSQLLRALKASAAEGGAQ